MRFPVRAQGGLTAPLFYSSVSASVVLRYVVRLSKDARQVEWIQTLLPYPVPLRFSTSGWILAQPCAVKRTPTGFTAISADRDTTIGISPAKTVSSYLAGPELRSRGTS